MEKFDKINILVFSFFLFCSLAFLIFQDGFWLYVDSAGWPMHFTRYIDYVQGSVLSFSNSTYFGYDSTTVQSSRIVSTLLKVLPPTLFYGVFFTLSLLSAFYTLRIYFTKEASFYGALVFTFNPVSLFFMKQVGYTYSYFSILLIVLGLYHYLSRGRVIYLIIYLLGIHLITSYTRLMGIYGFFLVILGIIYLQDIIYSMKKNVLRYITIFISSICVLLPYSFSLVYPRISGESAYFSGFSNFVSIFAEKGMSFYAALQNKSFVFSIFPVEIANDFATDWNKTVIFISISLLLVAINLGALVNKNSTNKTVQKIVASLLILFLFTISIHAGAKFYSPEVYLAIMYKYFPFIANNPNWLYLIYIPILSYFVSYNISNYTNKKVVFSLKTVVLLYVLVVLVPLMSYGTNKKLQLVDIGSAPAPYKELLLSSQEDKEPSVFLPSETLMLSWTPYHIKLHNNSNYLLLFNNDSRSVNNNQIKLKDLTYEVNENYSNLRLFNLKDVILYKDVKNVKNGTFNWYFGYDFEQKVEDANNLLYKNKDFFLNKENEYYLTYGLQKDINTDFFLYIPDILENKELDDFFETKIDFSLNPLFLHSGSFQKPDKVSENYKSPFIDEQEAVLSYKRSITNPTIVYLKVRATASPYILYLAKTFGVDWSVRLIDSELYNSIKCDTDIIVTPDSRNSHCTNNKFFDKNILFSQNYPKLGTNQNFEGNYIGNAWLIEEANLENPAGDGYTYMMITYDKQRYYIITLLVFSITFLVLLIIAVIQELAYLYKKRSASNA